MTRKCPDCGNRSVVIDSRETATTIRRTRECVKCYGRWSTWEVSANPDAALAGVREALKVVEKAIEDQMTIRVETAEARDRRRRF